MSKVRDFASVLYFSNRQLAKRDFCLVKNDVVKEKKVSFEDDKKKRKRLSPDDINQKIDETLEEVLHHFIEQASHGEQLRDAVSTSLQHAVKDAIDSILANEFEANEDTGYGVIQYENLEVYKGPTRLLDILDDVSSENTDLSNSTLGQVSSIQKQNADEASLKHGEIIINVPKGHKVDVKATAEYDTIIKNIFDGEVIIRNVDTDLVLSILHDNFATLRHGEFVEMSIVGQAYMKDLTGILKINQFKGIIVIKTHD